MLQKKQSWTEEEGYSLDWIIGKWHGNDQHYPLNTEEGQHEPKFSKDPTPNVTNTSAIKISLTNERKSNQE